MLGSKRHLQKDGAQAVAIVTDVEYAKVLGMAVAQNYNYKLKLQLMVKPEADAAFEAQLEGYFPQFAQPGVGDQLYVRYDPNDKSRVEIDESKIAAAGAAAEAAVVTAAAMAPPPDLLASGIIGRGALVDVQKTPAQDSLVQCVLTVGVRLIDGTPPYRTTIHALLGQPQADMLIPGQTFMTVRADASDHNRVALSLGEDTPVAPLSDPAVLEPLARALSEGIPIQVTVVAFTRQWLAIPDGSELYGVKVRVPEGTELQINVPVPASAVHLLQNGAQLPAKRLAAEPNVIVFDWVAAAGQ